MRIHPHTMKVCNGLLEKSSHHKWFDRVDPDADHSVNTSHGCCAVPDVYRRSSLRISTRYIVSHDPQNLHPFKVLSRLHTQHDFEYFYQTYSTCPSGLQLSLRKNEELCFSYLFFGVRVVIRVSSRERKPRTVP